MFRRIDRLEPRRAHCDRSSAGFQCAAMRLGIDTARQSTDNGHSRPCQTLGQPECLSAPIGRAVSRADDGDCKLIRGQQGSSNVEHDWRIRDPGELRWVGLQAPHQDTDPRRLRPLQLFVRRGFCRMSHQGPGQLRPDLGDFLKFENRRIQNRAGRAEVV